MVVLVIIVEFIKCVEENIVLDIMFKKVFVKVVDMNKKVFEIGKKYVLEVLKK